MSSPVFVRDLHGTPLMPMAPAHARKLLQRGKARVVPHHAFTILELLQPVASPTLRPVLLGIKLHLHTAELFLLAEGADEAFPLLYIVVDLKTDISRRLRRRAGHRRRRRSRRRYRALLQYGQAYKLRRPSLARSRWGAHLRRRAKAHGRRRRLLSPVMLWRAQAVERVIRKLLLFVPISHAIFLGWRSPMAGEDLSGSWSERREQLIGLYGRANSFGQKVAACSYCGRTDVPIEIDHLTPLAQGGTDALSNLVLACLECNQKKGDRTPAQAGLKLQLPRLVEAAQPQRAKPYINHTAQLLFSGLRALGLKVLWKKPGAHEASQLPEGLLAELEEFSRSPGSHAGVLVAKPIARSRKQVFSSRNYPLSTPSQPQFVRVRGSVKRRIKVNRGLLLSHDGSKLSVRVIGVDEDLPGDAGLLIVTGMLCEGQRAGHKVIGIVSAIHTAGRLTLLVPGSADPGDIVWQRVVISPRSVRRILSKERVLFLPLRPVDSDDLR